MPGMNETPQPLRAPPTEKSSLAKVLALLPSIMLPMFLAMVDQTIVAAALPVIAGDLGNASRVSWIVTAYLVASTISAPVYGRMGDLLGRKRLMAFALFVLIAGSVVSTFSTSMEMLTLGRVIQGLGGGGLMTLSQALIGEAVPPRDRGRYTGILATVGVSAGAFGAVSGGLLTAQFGWRSIFVVTIPFAIVALLLLSKLSTRAPTGGSIRFDFGGLALFAIFIVAALTLLGHLQGLDAEALLPVLGLLVLCVLAVLLLIRQEKRATHPLFPILLFRDPTVWRCSLIAMCHGALLVSLIAFLPILLRVRGADAATIGFWLLPLTAGIPFGAIITGQIVSRTGRTAIFPSVGLIFVVVILAAVSLWLPHFTVGQISGLLGLCAFFMGTVMGVIQITVQTVAGPTLLGTASASVQYSRSIGAALGTATVSAILFATLAAQDSEAAHMFVAILQQGPDVLLSLAAERRAIVQGEIAGAFRAAFLAMAIFGTGGMVLSWTLPVRRI
jgi:MFS family permease